MADIKTKDAVKGTIKTIDKSALVAVRMRTAYISTKEKAEHSVNTAENNASEYASDRIESTIDRGAHEAAHQLDKAGRKGVQTTKQNISKAKNGIRQFKEKRVVQNAERKTAHTAERQTVLTAERLAPSIHKGSGRIRTFERSAKTVKQSVQSAGNKTVKVAEKGAVKITKKSVKTAECTAKTTIKTTRYAAKTAQKTVQATAKTAHAAKVTAKAVVAGVKTAVKATTVAVKSIIVGTKALVAAIAAGGWVAVVLILIVVLFGGLLSVVGGGNSQTVQPVSAEVQAYEPLIRRYATEHGISEYVELIKAVMMQESGGRGLDPMQASEGSFNTRYPNTPNGITDPEYSVECGVQELKAALASASVENPVDMEHIKLALQGYNYGNGYISWAIEKDGGYTAANAIEFSDMMAQKLGWINYGDKQYVPHVLRYYPFGRIPTGVGNEAIVQVALSQVGNVGGQPYWSWYGFDGRVEWCACFVSWCADQCGYIESGIVPKFAGCVQGSQWFKDRGQWMDNSVEPAPGTIIFFDWEGDGEPDHVGIVEKCENGTVYTVEGNSGDTCRQRSYPIGSSVIHGYGTPLY